MTATQDAGGGLPTPQLVLTAFRHPDSGGWMVQAEWVADGEPPDDPDTLAAALQAVGAFVVGYMDENLEACDDPACDRHQH